MSKFDSLIDDLLKDLSVKPEGQDFRAISRKERDEKFLDSIAPGPHNTTQGGVVASKEDWRGKSNKVMASEDSIISGALGTIAGTEESQLGNSAHSLSDTEVTNIVTAKLTLGMEPRKVADYMRRLAEQYVFNRTLSDNILKDQSGLMGIAYIEPNHFMKSCTKTVEKIKREGQLKAAAVKQITACSGCQYFNKTASGEKRCKLYAKPIVGSQDELRKIIAAKFGSTDKSKLASIHDGEINRPDSMVSRVDVPVTMRTAGEAYQAPETFTSKSVDKMLKEGSSINAIYSDARKKVGSHKATLAIKAYINELKKNQTRVVIANLDCTLLKGKLATGNAIVGASKCASCTFRNGMHCGMTGGTLLAFPGMAEMKSNKAASANVKDGAAWVEEFGLDKNVEDHITMNRRTHSMDVEVDSVTEL